MTRDDLLLECFGRSNFPVPDATYQASWNGSGVIANVDAYHRKMIVGDGQVPVQVWGIAQVCTSEPWRNLGLARALLAAAHHDGRQRGYDFAVLFSDYLRFYEPLGYAEVGAPPLLIKYLAGRAWPHGDDVHPEGGAW